MRFASDKHRVMIETLLANGWRLVEGRHYRLYSPFGKGIVTMSRSTSCWYAADNALGDVRRVYKEAGKECPL